ncbi:MAG: flagellar basal body-associated FliL family protein [Hyphomicrobium aestuarii]|nr:flagellar basal body-associated FliL family protein [Hyphomicrobium aestuarii]
MAESENPAMAGAGGFVIPLLLLIVLGVGAGFGYGVIIGPPAPTPVATSGAGGAAAPPGHDSASASAEPSSSGAADRLKDHIVPLEPIIVNIGGGVGPWLRLEGSVAFSQAVKEGRDALVAQMTEDVAGYVRSTSLAQVQTAAGLEFLKDDLSEIVQLRTKGRARRFLLRSMVVE